MAQSKESPPAGPCSTPHNIPRLSVLQKFDELVRGTEVPFTKGRRSGGIHGFEQRRCICSQIHLRSLSAGVTQPQGHLANVTRRLQYQRKRLAVAS